MLSFSPLNSPVFNKITSPINPKLFGDWLITKSFKLTSYSKIEQYVDKIVSLYYWKSINVDDGMIRDLFRSNNKLIPYHSQIFYYLREIHQKQKFDFGEFEKFCQKYNVSDFMYGNSAYYTLYQIGSSIPI